MTPAATPARDATPWPDFDALTSRQREILRLYPEIGTLRMIADRMGISYQTVKNHASDIIGKLDVAHLGQAAVLFDRWESE